MESHNKRKSGLRNPFAYIEELDFSIFTEPYAHFREDYIKTLYAIKKREQLKPFKVTFVDDESLLYIAFAKNKDRAKGIAVKYFKENFHPDFCGRLWRDRYNKARATVVHEFLPYEKEQLVPIPELMKVLGVTFPCSACGKDNFTYEDYKTGRCFLMEGEGNLNVFTKGFVLCYSCYRKFMGEQWEVR